MNDPSPIIAALAAVLPHAWAIYLGDVVTVLSLLSLLSSVFAASIRPPSSSARQWLRTAYTVLTWPAFNLRWARNAVVPGMHAPVQEAALLSAKIAAAAPELATIAEPPGIAGKIVTRAPP